MRKFLAHTAGPALSIVGSVFLILACGAMSGCVELAGRLLEGQAIASCEASEKIVEKTSRRSAMPSRTRRVCAPFRRREKPERENLSVHIARFAPGALF